MNLIKRPGTSERVKLLQVGDPWTIIHDGNLTIDMEDGKPPRLPEPGELIGRWYSTTEPGRNFRVTNVTKFAIETVFEGFQEFEIKG